MLSLGCMHYQPVCESYEECFSSLEEACAVLSVEEKDIFSLPNIYQMLRADLRNLRTLGGIFAGKAFIQDSEFCVHEPYSLEDISSSLKGLMENIDQNRDYVLTPGEMVDFSQHQYGAVLFDGKISFSRNDEYMSKKELE